jgi:hypothetical protein
MSNASESEGRKPGEQTDAAAPFFPSEGRFNPVVPLSKVGEEAQAASPETQEEEPSLEAQASSLEDTFEPDEHEETTLVPARLSSTTDMSGASVSASSLSEAPMSARPVSAHTAHTFGQKRATRSSWPITLIAVALSVVAGLIAGAYLVGSKRAVEVRPPAVNDVAGAPVASEVKEKEAKEAAAATTENEATAKPETENVAEHAPKMLRPTPPSDTRAQASAGARPLEAEPSAHRALTDAPRTERNARAAAVAEERSVAEERNSLHASRSTQRRDSPATPSRRAQVLERRAASAPATMNERNLPVSAPPASSKSRKVIQWP